MRLIAWLGRANKLSVQNKGAVFHRLNDRIRKSQIPLLPIHKTRGSKGKSCLYCSTFDICQLILVVPSYVAKVLVCNWKARWTGEHWEPLPFPLSLNPQAAQRCPKVSRKNIVCFLSRRNPIRYSVLYGNSSIYSKISIHPNPQSHKHYSHRRKGDLPSSICRKLGIGVKKESEGIEDRFEKEIIQAIKVTLLSSVQSSLTLLKFGDFLKSPDS